MPAQVPPGSSQEAGALSTEMNWADSKVIREQGMTQNPSCQASVQANASRRKGRRPYMPDGTAGEIDWERIKREAAKSTAIARDPATDPHIPETPTQ